MRKKFSFIHFQAAHLCKVYNKNDKNIINLCIYHKFMLFKKASPWYDITMDWLFA